MTGIVMPWAYFNLSAMERLRLDLESVCALAGEWLQARAEIARAVPVSRLDDCREEELCRLIGNVTFEGRSGEIYVVGSRNSFVSMDPPIYAASHGSPYLRDRRVPVLFYGMDLKPQVVESPASPRHIAPTLALALGLPQLEQLGATAGRGGNSRPMSTSNMTTKTQTPCSEANFSLEGGRACPPRRAGTPSFPANVLTGRRRRLIAGMPHRLEHGGPSGAAL